MLRRRDHSSLARTALILCCLVASLWVSDAAAGEWRVGSAFGYPGDLVEIEISFNGDGQTVATAADLSVGFGSLSVPVESGQIGAGTGSGYCTRINSGIVRMFLFSTDVSSPLGAATVVCRIPVLIRDIALPRVTEVHIVHSDCSGADGETLPCSSTHGNITVHGIPGRFSTLPIHPVHGDSVQIEFYGSGCGGGGFDRIEGHSIYFRESISCSCFAAAPQYRVRNTVGPLDYGTYRVISSQFQEEPDDPELCGPPVLLHVREWGFLVGVGPREIPTAGRITLACLLLAMSWAAALALRGR